MTNVYFHNFKKLNTTELKKLYRSLFAILRLILARYCFVRLLIFLYLNFNVLHCAFMISDLTLILSLCLYTCITSGEKQLYSSPGYTFTSRFEATSYHVCWWVTIITRRNTANLQWFLWQRHEFHFHSSFNPHWLEIRTIFYFKHEDFFKAISAMWVGHFLQIRRFSYETVRTQASVDDGCTSSWQVVTIGTCTSVGESLRLGYSFVFWLSKILISLARQRFRNLCNVGKCC